MRKIVFFLDTGVVGESSVEGEEYPDDVTDERLNDEAWQLALQNAESFGRYPEEYYDQEYADSLDEDEREEYDNDFIHSIEGYWEDYDPEKHDGFALGKWSWED